VRVGSAEGMILGGVWCLADVEVSNTNTDAYDCLKKTQFINKSAKITEKKQGGMSKSAKLLV